MEIQNEDDVVALSVRQLRQGLGLNQDVFWMAIGVTRLRGHRYETGITQVIPGDVKRLVFLHYVIGIPTNASPDELRKLAGNRITPTTRHNVSKHLKRAFSALRDAQEAIDAAQPKPHSN